MHKDIYFETVSHIERLHRLFLELIHVELERLEIYDISNVQSLILYNIGTESKTLQDLTQKGYYLGSNMAYNVRKMVETGYLEYDKTFPLEPQDQIHFKLSRQGSSLYKKLDQAFSLQAGALGKKGVPLQHVQQTAALLHQIEDFWKSHTTA